MDIRQPKPKTRLERIHEKLSKHEALINSQDKGSIEVNFSGSSENISIKIVL